MVATTAAEASLARPLKAAGCVSRDGDGDGACVERAAGRLQ
jgi:hypothetical protein